MLLFNASLHVDRRRSLILGAVGLTVFVVCIVILVTRRFFGPELLAGLAWPTLAVAAGDAVRSRREAMAAAVDRAERAERSRDEETRRRVAEERLHIARELHDVIAHRIAVVNVQAGVAAHLMRADPDSADVALATVRSSARVVLDELTDMLGLLRTDSDSVAPVHPTPTLDDVPALVATFSAAGLSVAYETTGETRPVTAPVGLAMFRTVQEALTNAHKHGDGAARVRVVTGPNDIQIAIENRTRPDSAGSDGSGFGLIGMRERVHAVGGTVTTTGQPSGLFAVHARFPLSTSGGDGA